MLRVQLQQFEGPLDLLLFFIQRDEIEIEDIPIAHITSQFLRDSYINGRARPRYRGGIHVYGKYANVH